MVISNLNMWISKIHMVSIPYTFDALCVIVEEKLGDDIEATHNLSRLLVSEIKIYVNFKYYSKDAAILNTKKELLEH